ncbi:hypothetical protein F7Q99_28730 [Streptomyces kaniharaensis]|uniref:Uncharacterized protein n=1 Tax=Streptomyces kaniharaensis TaxID=212423 RepID=A0A6N7KZ64_9ACTN|nr:hypothetical protein [Streptomyces kaniharaensis]MQS16115.1 hypothetical protein [Streptomyces kaniharaensis]
MRERLRLEDLGLGPQGIVLPPELLERLAAEYENARRDAEEDRRLYEEKQRRRREAAARPRPSARRDTRWTPRPPAPRLRERLCTERQLITDATDCGWEREIERHQHIADRITSLLDDLGESHDEPAD